jgi:hypothetical protein
MKDRFMRFLAWLLPKRLVMWCAYRVGSHATQGKYSKQVVPDLMFIEAMERWENDDGYYDLNETLDDNLW